MARPIKQTIDYFPHFVSDGKTLLILQNEFHNDGYAFWFKLLELLCVSDGQAYDYNNPAEWRLLLAKTSVQEDTATKILTILADVGAIDKELHTHKIIWVQKLVDNLDLVYNRRSNGKPQKPVIANNNVVMKDISVNNNPVIANKSTHTKQNNTKQNNTIPVEPTALKEMFYSFKNDNGYKTINFENEFKKFCEYWLEGPRKLKNKKLACHNWLDHAVAYEKQFGGKDGTNKETYHGNPSQRYAGAFDDIISKEENVQ
jgi:hypothetical protein